MSLVPEFELGVWNGWILILTYLSMFIGFYVLLRLRGQQEPSRPRTAPLNENEKKLDVIGGLVFVASVIYSFFLPLKLGTAWFYVGFPVFSFGMIFTIIAGINLMSTPTDRPATKGLYRISRNPIYLGTNLIFIGIGIASASWLFLLLIAIFAILQHMVVGSEERWCLEKYGETYREYMNRTSKWIGLPKSEKK